VFKRRDNDKIQQQLKKELTDLRRRIAELEQAETERKQAEGALRESEEELEAIFNKVRDGIVLLDLTGKIIKINRRIAEVTGYSEKYIVGKRFNFFKNFPPTSIAKMTAAFIKAAAGQRVPPFDVIGYTKTGEKRIGEVYGSLLKKKGKAVGILVVMTDITDREQTEEALRESKEKYRTVVEISPDGIAISAKGRHVFVNQSLARMFGVSDPDELVGRPIMDYIHPDYRKIVRARLEEQTKRGALVPLIEEKMIRADGTVIDTEVAAAPLEYQGEQAVLAVIRDITVRKQAEEALRESEKKHRTILETMQDGYFEVDLGGNFTFFNDALCRIHGRSRDEMISLNNREYTTPETAKRIYAVYNKIYKTGISAKIVNYEVIRKDGAIAQVEDAVSLLRDPSGKPIGFCGVSRDRSEQRKAEEALRTSEQKYRDLVENINDLIYATDEHGIITYIAPRVEAVGGYKTSEIIGRPFFDFVHEEDVPYMRDMFKQDVSGRPKPHEYRAVTKSGDVRWVRTFGRPFFKEGRVAGLRGVSTDITARKRAEEALRESEEKYRLILSTMEEGYYEVDLSGNLIFFNDALCRIYGYTRDELIALNNREYMSPVTAKKTYQLFNKVFKTGEPSKIFDWEFIKKDGSIITIEISVSLRKDSQGNAVGFQGIVRDITERKQAEEALRDREESYRSILELAPDSITISRIADGRYLQVNNAFCQHTGYTPEEATGRTVFDLNIFVDPADRERLINAVRQRGRADGLEMQFRAKDGTILDDLVSAIPIRFRGEDCQLVVATNINALKKAQEALRESEQKYRTILQSMEEGYYEVDLRGNMMFCNDAICRNQRRSREELLGMNNRAYMTPETAKMIYAIFNKVYRTGIPVQFVNNEIIRKDGTVALLEESVSLLRNAAGEPIGFYGVSRDRTEQKQAEEALRLSEEKYRTIIENIEDGYYEVDLAGNFTFVNDAACRIQGYTRDEMIGMNNREYMDKKTAQKVYKIFNTVLRTGKSTIISHWQIIRKDGSQRDVESSVSLMRDASGNPRGFRGVIRDITARKQAEEELQYRATHDLLTDLPNRLLFSDRLSLGLAQAQRNHKKLAVMLLDLDYFKDVNDTMGHSAGDRLLRVVGNRLTELLRSGDTVARVGGDEFLLLLSEIGGIEDANTIAQKILEAFRRPFILDDHEIMITTSIGVAIFPDDGDNADILVKYADVAMYRAKDKGRDNFQRYTPA
jgi:diguanylate cyclase (GGDEF)-like protein/PAS domain S-box-containing protein